MERHQAGQEEALVEVRVEKKILDRPGGPPAHRRGCTNFAVALAMVMGLVIVALVVGFGLLFSTFPICNQNSHTSDAQAKFNITYRVKKSDKHLVRHDIVTVPKDAIYLIYGVVRDFTSDDVTLVQTEVGGGRERPMKWTNNIEGDIFFLDKVRLSNGSSISLVNSLFTQPVSCYFLVYEL